GDRGRPRWRAGAGAAAAVDGVFAAAGAGDRRQRGVGGGGGGHVGHAPIAAEAGDLILVAGPREDAAEAAARGLEVAAGTTERQTPGDLADVGACLVAGGQGRAAGGEDERVGRGQVGFLDRAEGAADQALVQLA